MNQFLELFNFFFGQDDFDIRASALQVGFKSLSKARAFYALCTGLCNAEILR